MSGALVVYDNIYSDGKDGSHYGGVGNSPTQKTDAQGNFSASWTVLPGAPSGDVKLIVSVIRERSTGFSQDQKWRVAVVC